MNIKAVGEVRPSRHIHGLSVCQAGVTIDCITIDNEYTSTYTCVIGAQSNTSCEGFNIVACPILISAVLTIKCLICIHMLRYSDMTFPISNSMNITQLYILPLPRAGPSLTTLEHRLPRPRNTCTRVTDTGGNHPDNP